MAVCEVFGFRTTIERTYKDVSFIHIHTPGVGILPTYNISFMQSPFVEDVGFVAAKLVFYPLVVAAFLLNCWADAAPLSTERALAQQVRIPSKVSFSN